MYDLLTVDAEISYVLNVFCNETKKILSQKGNDSIENICTVVCKSGVCKCVYSCATYYETCVNKCNAVILHVNVYQCTANCFNQRCKCICQCVAL